MTPTNRRDLLFSIAERRPTADFAHGYTPAAFFLHFGPEFRVGAAAIERHEEFFRHTGMDFVKIQYELPFPQQAIEKPSDWRSVPVLDEGYFEPMLGVVAGLVGRLKREAPVVVTLYSPFMCAGQVAGHAGGTARVTQHLEQDPELVRKGLESVTESLRAFVDACIRIGVDGFYHSTQGGESRRFTRPGLFAQHIKPFDLAIMEEINRRCPFNILHICDYHRNEVGGYDDLNQFVDYPGQIVNCSLDVGGRRWTPAEVASLLGRPFFGGVDRLGPIATATETDARSAARAALDSFPANDRASYMLGADCTVPGDTPWNNLRAAIAEAHGPDA